MTPGPPPRSRAPRSPAPRCVAAAQAAHDVVAQRYAAAAVPQLELIAARNALLSAETDRVVAINDLHLRLVELDRVTELALEAP
ncbi:MAG: hypothetical protein R2939_16160 [Kofleriaceae bacterium]